MQSGLVCPLPTNSCTGWAFLRTTRLSYLASGSFAGTTATRAKDHTIRNMAKPSQPMAIHLRPVLARALFARNTWTPSNSELYSAGLSGASCRLEERAMSLAGSWRRIEKTFVANRRSTELATTLKPSETRNPTPTPTPGPQKHVIWWAQNLWNQDYVTYCWGPGSTRSRITSFCFWSCPCHRLQSRPQLGTYCRARTPSHIGGCQSWVPKY